MLVLEKHLKRPFFWSQFFLSSKKWWKWKHWIFIVGKIWKILIIV